MRWQPYHHDWKLAYGGVQHWRIHWFGRYTGYPEGMRGLSRLSPDMVNFGFIERNASWARVNGRRIPLRPGDLLVMSGADEFVIGHNPARPHVTLSASLSLSQGAATNLLLQWDFKRVYRMPDPARYVQVFEAVLAAMASTSRFRDLRIAGALGSWLGYLLEVLDPPLRHVGADDRSVVDHVLAAQAWADARLDGVITLAGWAASVGLNPVYFGRVFKRETGMKPMEWLNQRRLEMAAQYLSGTSWSVAEVAAGCGYACPFYFSRRFRQYHGLSPLRYRKTNFGKARRKKSRRA